MFGYVVINKPELKIREYETYRSYYCGLCAALKKRDGRISQLLLNYDCTFLAILLDGLYEPPEEQRTGRCVVRPVRKHPYVCSEVIDYCADMTVLLSYEKALDDWKDDKKGSALAMSGLLKSHALRIEERYPRQAGTLKGCLDKLAEAEWEGSGDVDYVSGLTGQFLGELFVWKEDEWAGLMRTAGFYLGKFIYLTDAFEDLLEDEKKGRYNVLLRQKRLLEQPDELDAVMNDTMARCAAAFEKLPVLKNAQILRNILYSGVWTGYNTVKEKRKKTDL